MPGQTRSKHDAGGRADPEQPTLATRRVAVHRARGFTEHAAIEAPRRLGSRQAPVQRAELAAVVVEQALEVAVVVVRVHDWNLARMRASA